MIHIIYIYIYIYVRYIYVYIMNYLEVNKTRTTRQSDKTSLYRHPLLTELITKWRVIGHVKLVASNKDCSNCSHCWKQQGTI